MAVITFTCICGKQRGAGAACSISSQACLIFPVFHRRELSKYVDSYIQEGYFNQGWLLYLFPVAKSTEITMLNKTDWEPFAEAAGTTVDELAIHRGNCPGGAAVL